MIAMMNDVTAKPDWEAKVFDESIVNKWRSEAASEIMNFSHTMFDFVRLDENGKKEHSTKLACYSA